VKHALILAIAVLVAACGGGGSGGEAAPQANQAPAPSLSLSANPTSVPSGATTTLSWTSNNATSCSASGAWSGNRATSGNFTSGALTTDSTFTLSCNGAGGGVVARVTVSVTANNPISPSARLTASPQGVPLNGSTTLNWTSSNVDTCTASGGWSGAKATSGSEQSAPIAQDQTYRLSCSGPNGNALAMVTVGVRRAVLTWTAPTQNVDGSPLTNLGGYKVYWGTRSRTYGTPATVNAGVTTYTLDLAPGTYYFALTAFDATGAESSYTNEVGKTVL
jgi:hypothetical protein